MTSPLVRSLFGLGAAALVAGLWFWWQAPADPGGAPAPRAATTLPAPAAATVAAPPPNPGATVRAGLARALRAAPLPPALLAQLVSGDVAGVVHALAAANEPHAAAQLADLAALCAAGGAGADGAVLDAHRALAIVGDDAALTAFLNAGLDARAAWYRAAEAGCALTELQPGELRRRLIASAAAGDAASAARLAAEEPDALPRLTTAALLGDAGAAWRLGRDNLAREPLVARSWLEAAAKGDAEAAAYLGACLASACYGESDLPGARAALEAAAKRGSHYALGLLATQGTDEAGRWPMAGLPPFPQPPSDTAPLVEPSTRFAYATLAAALAREGCFGFEFALTAAALTRAAEDARSVRPGELDSFRDEGERLRADSLAGIRRALACD
jgi:hypothetical protein